MEKSSVLEMGNWIISNVVPIFKKDEKCKVENYRPVSLKPQLSTNSTISLTPQLSTNSTISLTPQLSTNSTISPTPQLSTNSTISPTPQLSTNSTISLTPQLSTNSTISLTPQLSKVLESKMKSRHIQGSTTSPEALNKVLCQRDHALQTYCFSWQKPRHNLTRVIL